MHVKRSVRIDIDKALKAICNHEDFRFQYLGRNMPMFGSEREVIGKAYLVKVIEKLNYE